MIVLFVSSGNSSNGISSIVRQQGESLIDQDVKIDFFTIQGKGISGYLKNRKKLRAVLGNENYDLIHAHYSLSGFLVSLMFTRIPILVSLMGSDTKMRGPWKIFLRLNYRFFWKAVIVKSQKMKQELGLDKVYIVPNGVNTQKFAPHPSKDLKAKLGWSDLKRHVLFAANPDRPEKNFELFKKSTENFTPEKYEVHVLKGVSHDDIPNIMNAADVVVLSSHWEGSPNVIKEAMACNRPIVSTNVGDISWLLQDCPGGFISAFNPEELGKKINMALKYTESEGRSRITKLKLSQEEIANRLLAIYKETISI